MIGIDHLAHTYASLEDLFSNYEPVPPIRGVLGA
jgi:hypothetical protein